MSSEAEEPQRVHFDAVTAVQVHTSSGTDPSEMSAAFGQAFNLIGQFIHGHGAQVTGPPRGIFTSYGPEGTEFTVAMPVASGAGTGSADGAVVVDEIPGGEALCWMHKGPYAQLSVTYDKITDYMKAHGMLETESEWQKHGPMWEEYLSDPGSTPEEELLTRIYLPVT